VRARFGGWEARFAGPILSFSTPGYLDPVKLRKKQERNLRLLEMDCAENPEDPFVLFNLGWVYQGLGRAAEAVPSSSFPCSRNTTPRLLCT
jgi:hypothetical protein